VIITKILLIEDAARVEWFVRKGLLEVRSADQSLHRAELESACGRPKRRRPVAEKH